MNIRTFAKLAVSLTFLCTTGTTLAGGGGGNGDNNTDLPLPDNCNANCGFETGPTPTLNFLRAAQGPQSVSTFDVPNSVAGFGGGTIYYPADLDGELASISIAPGFTNTKERVAWWGPILASHGFIVFIIDTNSRFDQPDSRSRQLDTALSYLIEEGQRNGSALQGRVDANRLATMGYSMGGGGSLISASRNRLSATLPFSPYATDASIFQQIRVPAMIMACENDGTAPVSVHASPFYNAIPASTDKAFIEFSGGEHGCATGDSSSDLALLSTYGVSWMKRFLDKDRRFDPFLCGPNHQANSAISEYRDTCNY